MFLQHSFQFDSFCFLWIFSKMNNSFSFQVKKSILILLKMFPYKHTTDTRQKTHQLLKIHNYNLQFVNIQKIQIQVFLFLIFFFHFFKINFSSFKVLRGKVVSKNERTSFFIRATFKIHTQYGLSLLRIWEWFSLSVN